MELKELIKNSEQRVKEYKELLSNVFRNKDIDYPDWYKQLLRENKNREEVWLKELVKEKTYENQGLNPPFCYKY
ncbi:MAG: hypothetical protein GF317_08775 [Candidatus Lokiarchaeota archaeon]|nr:hypothetical protein [Candidatus Lokiarchaeota archaeon]